MIYVSSWLYGHGLRKYCFQHDKLHWWYAHKRCCQRNREAASRLRAYLEAHSNDQWFV